MLVKSGSRTEVREEVVWTRSLDGPFLVAKESNQTKSRIGRSRSLRLDSSPVWSRGRDKAYLGDKFALGRFLVRLITALGFIKLGFGTLVEP